MKRLFVDANIYLSFYHYSGDDLDRLKALRGFIEAREIKLYVNSQLKDEFTRNREAKLNDAMSTFTVPAIRVPRVFDQYPEERKSFLATRERLKEQHKLLVEKYKLDLELDFLTADNIVNGLLKDAESLDEAVINAARSRVEFGNPPGKKGSLGDALHWEFLLHSVPDDEDIAIVSADRDWASSLDENRLTDYLVKEWHEKKNGEARLYRSMSSYFKDEFPHIKLEGEYEKDLLIQRLGSSRSFDESRKVIRKLVDIGGDFSDEQIGRIIKFSNTNGQVYRAHEYSPTIVGNRLRQLIGAKTGNATEEELEQFNILFPPPTEPDTNIIIDLDSIPF